MNFKHKTRYYFHWFIWFSPTREKKGARSCQYQFGMALLPKPVNCNAYIGFHMRAQYVFISSFTLTVDLFLTIFKICICHLCCKYEPDLCYMSQLNWIYLIISLFLRLIYAVEIIFNHIQFNAIWIRDEFSTWNMIPTEAKKG